MICTSDGATLNSSYIVWPCFVLPYCNQTISMYFRSVFSAKPCSWNCKNLLLELFILQLKLGTVLPEFGRCFWDSAASRVASALLLSRPRLI